MASSLLYREELLALNGKPLDLAADVHSSRTPGMHWGCTASATLRARCLAVHLRGCRWELTRAFDIS